MIWVITFANIYTFIDMQLLNVQTEYRNNIIRRIYQTLLTIGKSSCSTITTFYQHQSIHLSSFSFFPSALLGLLVHFSIWCCKVDENAKMLKITIDLCPCALGFKKKFVKNRCPNICA